MAVDAGKTVGESDPEISEAVDLAHYYAREAGRLDTPDAGVRPVGPGARGPPWNFPPPLPPGRQRAADKALR